MFKGKYRIETDNLNGYTVRVKYWFSFTWSDITFGTYVSIDEAENFINLCKKPKYKGKIIK